MGEASRDQNRVMDAVRATVFKKSESLDGEGGCTKIEGYDFNRGVDYPQLLNSLLSTGFQASNLGEAIQIVNEMVCFITSKKMFFFRSFCWTMFSSEFLPQKPKIPSSGSQG